MNNAFGLDIGSETIKIMQLVKKGAKPRVVAAGVAKNPLLGFLIKVDKNITHKDNVHAGQ